MKNVLETLFIMISLAIGFTGIYFSVIALIKITIEILERL